MGNLQRTSDHFSFVDVTLQADALFDVVHSAKNWRSKHCTSHAWRSALIIQRTQTVLYHTLPGNFGVFFFGEIHHPGACFRILTSAQRLEMIENGSYLARKWCIWVGVEPNATIGQLVKMRMPIGCGTTNISKQKGTRTTGYWRIWCPHKRMGLKKNKKCFSEGEHRDMTMSVAA